MNDFARNDWDLNCDLGEGEPPRRTAALFASITSANVACGGHAGDASSMRRCAELAARHDVRLGAHPGIAGEFGRAPITLSAGDLAEHVEAQLHEFRRTVSDSGRRVHHVKLHGAFYHLSEADPEHALSYLRAVRRVDPALRVYALAGGRVATLAPSQGIEAWPEAFLDRGYYLDGSLVPRTQPGALLNRPQIHQRVLDLAATGRVQAIDGSWIILHARTWCLHSDTRGAEWIARLARGQLSRRFPKESPDSHVGGEVGVDGSGG